MMDRFVVCLGLSLGIVLVLVLGALGEIFCPSPVILDFGEDAIVTRLPFTIRNCGSVTSDFTVSTGYVPGQDTDFIVDIDPTTAISALPSGGEVTLTVEITRSGFAPGGPYKNYIKVFTDSYTECEFGCLYEVRMSVPSQCTWKDMFPESRHFEAGGGMGNVQVTTDSGCPSWTPEPQNAWISILVFNESTGTFSYLVAPNTGGERSGEIHAAGLVHTVTQEGGATCTYSISPSGESFTSAGGSGIITVTTQDGCLWEASRDVDWITFSTQDYWAGPGSLGYSVASNPGPARTGHVSIADHQHTVSQAPTVAGECDNDTTAPEFSIEILRSECDCSTPGAPDCFVELRWPTQDNCTAQPQHRYRLDDGAWTRWLTNTTHYATGELSLGEHAFRVEAKDDAGNLQRNEIEFALACQSEASEDSRQGIRDEEVLYLSPESDFRSPRVESQDVFPSYWQGIDIPFAWPDELKGFVGGSVGETARLYYESGDRVHFKLRPGCYQVNLGVEGLAAPLVHVGWGLFLTEISEYRSASCIVECFEAGLGWLERDVCVPGNADSYWLSVVFSTSWPTGAAGHIEVEYVGPPETCGEGCCCCNE